MSGPQNESQAAEFLADCERIHREWHERAKAVDTGGLLALYSKDAVLESPLVPAILDDKPDGVFRGHEELRHFFEQGGRRRPNDLVRWYRTGDWLTDGRRLLVWNIRGKRQMAIR
jgi:steroid delta-isomerase